MITQKMMLGGGAHQKETWRLLFNTEATTVGNKIIGIPFNLYGQNGTLFVDWGDGNVSSLTSADYSAENTGASPVLASIHEYSTAGVYTVTLTTNSFEDFYYFGCNSTPSSYNDGIGYINYFKSTVVSILDPLPYFAGSKFFSTSTATGSVILTYDEANNNNPDRLVGLFSRCGKLSSIPDNLLSNPKYINESREMSFALTSFFNSCSSLSILPLNLFSDIYISSCQNCFVQCNSLGDFSLRFTAKKISRATNFVPPKAGATRIIYVPAGSKTETTFNAVASDLGLTIIGE